MDEFSLPKSTKLFTEEDLQAVLVIMHGADEAKKDRLRAHLGVTDGSGPT